MNTSKTSFEDHLNYLDLVEEHKEEGPLNLFEKVLIMSTRARDLYAGKTSRAAGFIEVGKPTAVAQYELLKGMIEPEVTDQPDKPDDYLDEIEYE
jgi:DNA-directed RNA polymerase subunit K/omega